MRSESPLRRSHTIARLCAPHCSLLGATALAAGSIAAASPLAREVSRAAPVREPAPGNGRLPRDAAGLRNR